MSNLIKIATIVVLAAAVTGNLPKLLYQVRKAKLQLIQDSKASK